MADNSNSIGGVSVQITGDASGLGPSFAAAQQQATAAGAQIAQSFNAGAAGADQITAAIERLTVALREESAAASLADQRNASLGRGFQQIGQHAEHGTFSVRYLFLGLKDLAEGRTTFALAEGANQLARYGPEALVVAAAVGVLVATFYGFKKAAEEVREELEKVGKEIDSSFDSAQNSIEKVTVALQSLQFGSAAGKALEGFYTKDAAARDIDKVHKLGMEVDSLVRQASQFHFSDMLPYFGSKARADEQKAIIDKQAEQQKLVASAEVKNAEALLQKKQEEQQRAEQAGRAQVARIANQEQANAHLAALNKTYSDEAIAAAHATEAVRIALLQDRQAAAVEAAAEEVRVEKEKQKAVTAALAAELPARLALIRQQGAAEAQGKSAPERALIGTQTQGRVDAAQAKADDQTLAASKAVQDAQDRLALAGANYQREQADRLSKDILQAYEARQKKARETFIIENTPGAVATLTGQRVGEIRAKNAGELDALHIAGQRAQIEIAYSAQKTHTLAQEVAYRKALLGLQDQEYAAKARGLQADLAIAQDDERSVEGTEKQIAASARVAELEGQIARLTEEQANARAAGAAQTQRLGRGAQVRDDFKSAQAQLGPALGGAIAKGVFDGGKGIGADIKNALKGIGEQLLGHVIDQLVVTLVANTIATNANTLWLAISGFLGFADGGSPPIGVPSMVGERGPELFVPHQAGTIIPHHMLKGYADGAGLSSVASSSAFNSVQIGSITAHGVSSPHQFVDHVMRELPKRLKTRTSQFSAYSR